MEVAACDTTLEEPLAPDAGIPRRRFVRLASRRPHVPALGARVDPPVDRTAVVPHGAVLPGDVRAGPAFEPVSKRTLELGDGRHWPVREPEAGGKVALALAEALGGPGNGSYDRCPGGRGEDAVLRPEVGSGFPRQAGGLALDANEDAVRGEGD